MTRPAPKAVVVGAGILGTWHAYELSEMGFAVDHLETDPAPLGASVRNFGLVWVSGRRSGSELAVARRARARWEQVSARVRGIGFRPAGSLTVAMTAAERAVMAEFSRGVEAKERGTVFLEPDEVRRANPAVLGEVTGALFCGLDAVVEPRLAPQALRSHLASRAPERYRFHPGCRVMETAPGAVFDTAGRRWSGDLVVIATGAAYDQLPRALPVSSRLRRVRLQMFETAPYRRELTTALADADSLRYYPAYEHASRHELGKQSEIGARGTICSCSWSNGPTVGSRSATPMPTRSRSTSRSPRHPRRSSSPELGTSSVPSCPRSGDGGRACTRSAGTVPYASASRSTSGYGS